MSSHTQGQIENEKNTESKPQEEKPKPKAKTGDENK